jgi:hypothetical protein
MIMYMNVRDKGPRDPVAPDDPEDKDAVAAHKAALKEQADWREAHPDEPPVYRWAAVDAQHAVAADPERYEIVPDAPGRPAHLPPPSMTERMFAAEARLDRLEAKVFPEEHTEPEPELEPKPKPEPEPQAAADRRVSSGPRPGEPAGTNP